MRDVKNISEKLGEAVMTRMLTRVELGIPLNESENQFLREVMRMKGREEALEEQRRNQHKGVDTEKLLDGFQKLQGSTEEPDPDDQG